MWHLDIFDSEGEQLAQHSDVTIENVWFELVDRSGRRSGLVAKDTDDKIIEALSIDGVESIAFTPDGLSIRGICGTLLAQLPIPGVPTTVPRFIYGEPTAEGGFKTVDAIMDELPEHIWKPRLG